jgi:CRP/FNR family transcriptional regulator, cyclic AMP receptor protein
MSAAAHNVCPPAHKPAHKEVAEVGLTEVRVTGKEVTSSTADFGLLFPLPEADRRRVLSKCVRRRFKRGQAIFHEGDIGESLHLITKGKIAVKVVASSGNVVTVEIKGPGQYFGEQALITGTRRNATIVAKESVETLMLERTQFEELSHSHPAVTNLLVAALSERVTHLLDLLVDALYLPANERVLRRTWNLATLYGNGTSAVIPLTQADIAEMAGTTTSTVNRTLRSIVKPAGLRLYRGRIEIDDISALERLSH